MEIKLNDKNIKIYEAYSFYKALKGFMFKKNINYGLIFKTNSIHTFFMKENIDVIQTDKNYNIIRIYKNLNKNKIIWPKKKIYYTIELPAGTITNLKEKDRLIITN